MCFWAIKGIYPVLDDIGMEYDMKYALRVGKNRETRAHIFVGLQFKRRMKIYRIKIQIKVKYKKEVYDIILNRLHGKSSDICGIICDYL